PWRGAMVQLRCDKCEKLIEVDDARPGDKVECPACGDINVVRTVAARVAPAAAPDRAGAAGYPPSTGPEVDVLVLRPAMFRSRPMAYTGVVVLILGGLAGAVLMLHSPPLAALC